MLTTKHIAQFGETQDVGKQIAGEDHTARAHESDGRHDASLATSRTIERSDTVIAHRNCARVSPLWGEDALVAPQ
jgi:hypothetical protein